MQFLDKVVDVSVVFLGSLVGIVQFLEKAADVPVAVPPVVFEVFSQDGLYSVLLIRSSIRQGYTVLKTVEVPQLQFIIVGLEMQRIETMLKTVEVPQLPSPLCGPVLGQVC